MHLKRLELVGFKSFAQKTVLDFPAGIAAVVGPNGSGKSNIIDAVRWLLGEREAKNMRGLKAEDLIFAGTPQRPRVGLAQAMLVFDNASRFFPVDYSEVSVRRRVERDGTSQYFLNDAEVRLKDIIDFFAQSRLGTKGFSIINQGDADLFVRASPKERREMMEEILGLRQFQIKKHDAELKLEATKFNMEKAQALLGELLPHLKILRRQTAKWAKHDEFARELAGLESLYFGVKLHEISEEERRLKPELEKLEAETAKIKGELAGLERELERVGKAEPKQEKDFGKTELEKEGLYAEHARLERELGRLEARMELLVASPESDFNSAELVRLLEETRETLEDALTVSDLTTIKKLLRVLSEKISHLLDADHESAPKASAIEEDASEAREKIKEELEKIEKRLDELKREEGQETAELKYFKTAFKKAYEAVQAKRDEFEKAEARKNQLLISRERTLMRREEIERQAVQIGRKISDFRPVQSAGEDINSVERHMLRLRGELSTIGEIDPAVVKEAEESESRHEFLTRELDDLNKAFKDLSALIEELDRKIHNGFVESLKAINEEFQKFFKMMFGGGHAKLKILNPKSEIRNEENGISGEVAQQQNEDEKIEMSGLDIELSIPRKRITGLDMLSGGEKSLVSLAVLFALISVSPPPFLVLDEVDAALDDANTKSFADLVKDFSKKVQFVIVTHNRATMEAADILYGITMGEDGTSKVLSLKLE